MLKYMRASNRPGSEGRLQDFGSLRTKCLAWMPEGGYAGLFKAVEVGIGISHRQNPNTPEPVN